MRFHGMHRRRGERTVVVRMALVAAIGFAACQSPPSSLVDGGSPAPDAGADASVPGPVCSPEPGLIEPIWIAGAAGARAELGGIGRVDAIFLDDDGLLLAGDEAGTHEELHIFDYAAEDPAAGADALPALADLGADPGPEGTGPLEFNGISGFAKHPGSGEIFVVEQGNVRVQRIRRLADREAPFYEFVAFFGTAAADPNAPADGEFVRLQSARFDSMGRLYLSDDAKGRPPTARKDIQIFDGDLQFVGKFGDSSYGEIGQDGNLEEPENFVLDEERNRIYVCDESPKNVVAYSFDSHEFVQRFGASDDTPNGIDVDQYGYIYVIYEGSESFVRIFDPDTLTEVFRFGGKSEEDDLTPGRFNTPDTLYIDVGADLLAIADQGHDRVQGFSLSEIQARACIGQLRLTVPPRLEAGQRLTVRVDLVGGDGRPDRSVFEQSAILSITEVETGDPVQIGQSDVDMVAGVGSATVDIDAPAGEIEVTARLAGLSASRRVQVLDDPPVVSLTGLLDQEQARWSAEQGVIRLAGVVEIPVGVELSIAAGTLVKLEAGARIDVYGDLLSRGTAESPVIFYPADPAQPWGWIQHHEGSAVGRYTHTFFVGAGAGPESWPRSTFGHCCIPAIYAEDGDIDIVSSLFADSAGKGITSRYGATADIVGTLFQRLGMAAELRGAGGLVVDTTMASFSGTDESDGLYLAGPAEFSVLRTVIAHGADDGIDTLETSSTITDTIIYDFGDKGMSIDGAHPVATNALVAGSRYGIVIKDGGGSHQALMEIIDSTLSANEIDLWIRNANGPTETGLPMPVVSRSILWGAPTSITSDYELTDVTVDDSVVRHPVGTSGSGNISEDPMFVDPAAVDYQLHGDSPARQLGDGMRGAGFRPW